ncbi:MAG: MarR family winged helix-turn-helix transcriptional regulator [Phenylobacterium sp.]
MRPRNAVLAAMHLFKALGARVSVNEIVAFLYVCENEGLTVQELADVARLTQSTASRSVRALGPAGSAWAQPPALGLVEAYLNPNDGRSHVIHLSEQGRDVRDRLDAIIREAVPIAEEPRAFGVVAGGR